MQPRLAGKVAFITGAARGQGRAHALRLASEGADVIISDICGPATANMVPPSTPEDLQETVKQVEALDRRVVARQADVRDIGALTALADEGVAQLGHIDIVCANAGVLAWGNAWEISEEDWQGVIDTNLTGVFHTIKATVPHMIRQGTGGSIILTSSSAGIKGQPFLLHYVAAKHGVVGICNALANELGEYNIRVNSVHPAGVSTAMTNVPGLFQLIQDKAETLGPLFMNTLPLEFLDPSDVSATVAFLASDESRGTTGMQFKIDLGSCNR